MDIQVLSDELIAYGMAHHMQDLYIYSLGESGDILFRQSTTTEHYRHLPLATIQQLIARFKYLGEMDVGEKRKAQLGAITYQLDDVQQRLRLSSVGDYRGQESMVIRFLHSTQRQMNYFFPEDLAVIQEQIQQKVGLYLFSGPTGSGKTTLMYELAKRCTGQVITIEDPVEIEEATFLQLQTNEKIGQTYDQLIKLALRHRPDLLIIGEIRDQVTAFAAIRAALTGHTVLATVHAKGLQETKSRLLDLVGTDTELKHCLNGVLYQQLFTHTADETKALLGYEFFFEKYCKESFRKRYEQLKRQGIIHEKRNFS